MGSFTSAQRGLVCLALLVGGSALAIGGVHPETIGVLACVAALGLIIGPTEWHPLAWLLFGLGTLCFVQALPLPSQWVKFLSPSAAEVWSRAEMSSGHAVTWSLSVDPAASRVEGTKWLSYGAIALLSRGVGRSVPPTRIARIVFGSGLIIALATLAHGLADAERVYGIYAPSFDAPRWSMGPLLNGNNLAGYLNLAFFVGLGLLLRTGKRSGYLVGLGLAVLLGVSMLTTSRGGLLALLVGGATCSIAMARRSRRGAIRGLQVGFALVTACVFAALAAPPTFLNEAVSQNVDKLRLVRWSGALVNDYAWTGVGRGAFESVFPAYDFSTRNLRYAHVENFVLQWVVDWGVPVGGVALIAVAYLFRPKTFSYGKRMLGTCAFAGVLATALHNLFDLGFEVPALMIPLVALGSWPWSKSPQRSTSARSTYALSALLVLAGVGVFAFGRQTLKRDHHEIARQYEAAKTTQLWDGFVAAAEAAVLRHPADPFLPRMAALGALRSEKNPLPFIEHALERDPNNGRAHLLLAEVLKRRKFNRQALLELKLALRNEPGLVGPAADAALRMTKDPALLTEAAPKDTHGRDLLVLLASKLPNPADEERLLKEAGKLDGDGSKAQERLAAFYIKHIGAGTSPCAAERRAACQKAAEEVLTAISAQQLHTTKLLRARLALALGDPPLAELEIGLDDCRSLGAIDCYHTLFTAKLRGEHPETSAEVGDQLLASVCMSRDRCALEAERLGDIAATHERFEDATAFLSRATREGATATRYRKLGDAAKRAGHHQLAAEAFRNADRLEGHKDPNLRRLIESEATRRATQP